MPRTRNNPVKRPLQDITHRFAATKSPRKPSPLPPSSPPSVSSQLLEYVDSDFDPNELVLQTRVVSSPKSNGSDPFGFFAVEKKLKVQRDTAPAQRKVQKMRAASLKVTRVEHEHYLATPSTPKKQRIRPPESGALTLSEAFEDSPPFKGFAVDPASPSPSKPQSRIEGTEARLDSTVEEDHATLTDQEPPLRRSARRRTGIVDPVKAEPKAKLPKRKARRTSAKPKKPVRRKPTARLKQVEKEDPDVKEKLAQERQERIEYFKKLEDYQVAKENVYII